MAKKIRLGLDLDGVLFDFNTAFCQLLEREYVVKMPVVGHDWPTEWDYPTLGGFIDPKQDRQTWSGICGGKFPGFWAGLPLYSWSTHLMHTGTTIAQETYFITSRCGPHRLAESTQALHNLTDKVIMQFKSAWRPTLPVLPVDSHTDKLPIINALRLTHYMDDRFDTMILAGTRCVNTKLALWDQPWNRHADIPGVERLTSVEEFQEWLQ